MLKVVPMLVDLAYQLSGGYWLCTHGTGPQAFINLDRVRMEFVHTDVAKTFHAGTQVEKC